jgi:hypothetical protein
MSHDHRRLSLDNCKGSSYVLQVDKNQTINVFLRALAGVLPRWSRRNLSNHLVLLTLGQIGRLRLSRMHRLLLNKIKLVPS